MNDRILILLSKADLVMPSTCEGRVVCLSLSNTSRSLSISVSNIWNLRVVGESVVLHVHLFVQSVVDDAYSFVSDPVPV